MFKSNFLAKSQFVNGWRLSRLNWPISGCWMDGLLFSKRPSQWVVGPCRSHRESRSEAVWAHGVENDLSWCPLAGRSMFNQFISHRIHGAGIYANMTGVYWWDPCYHIYQHHGSYGYDVPMMFPWFNGGFPKASAWRLARPAPHGEFA